MSIVKPCERGGAADHERGDQRPAVAQTELSGTWSAIGREDGLELAAVPTRSTTPGCH